MCKAFYQEQPHCGCVYITGKVQLCLFFTALPENKGKTSFSPKLLTRHCQGLDLFFNGVNYVSLDIEEDEIAPNGLNCPYLELVEQWEDFGECVLCDTQGVLKFLKAKRVLHTPVVKKNALDLQDEAVEEEGAEDVRGMAAGKSVERSVGGFENRVVGSSVEKGQQGGAEDVRGMAAGKSVERSVGGFENKVVGSSVEKGGVVDKVNRTWEMVMVEGAGKKLAGKRKRSHLAEDSSSSSSASMGWD